MRLINIANEKKRNAVVNFGAQVEKSAVHFVLPDGSAKKTTKFLKTSLDTDISTLEEKFGTLDDVAVELVKGDPEVDLERTGMKITDANRLYVTKDYKVVFGVNFEEVVHNPDGSEKERQEFVKKESNINCDAALRWTGKKVPKDKAVRMFVFSKKYQLRHTSGLTYDFLFDMAKELHDANALMFIGGGAKGNEPLIMMDNGVPHRAFLEGRVEGNRYMLILHLTNLELKELE